MKWNCGGILSTNTIHEKYSTNIVKSKYAGKGIGKEIFNQIKDNATKNNKKAVDLSQKTCGIWVILLAENLEALLSARIAHTRSNANVLSQNHYYKKKR